jgi:RNA polymerase sigma-70 factor, ECF subfamily
MNLTASPFLQVVVDTPGEGEWFPKERNHLTVSGVEVLRDHSVEGRPLEDQELIELVRNGDVEAYGSLVRRYQEVAFRIAYLVTRNAAEAQDATQEAFLKAHAAIDGFRAGGSFKAWLLAIVANEARNRIRASTRRSNWELRTAPDRLSGDAAPSPESAVLAQEERDLLMAAVNQLRVEERLTIECRYFLDLTEKEMAEMLRIAPGTVKSRLSRAKYKLRLALETLEGERKQSGEVMEG